MSYGRNCLVSDIDENVQVCENYATTFEKANVEDLKEKLELCIPYELNDRIIYIDNDCKDIWDWSEKVYRIIER